MSLIRIEPHASVADKYLDFNIKFTLGVDFRPSIFDTIPLRGIDALQLISEIEHIGLQLLGRPYAILNFLNGLLLDFFLKCLYGLPVRERYRAMSLEYCAFFTD
ncbi:hypothetical protein D3C72_2308880 [compost metagenome]